MPLLAPFGFLAPQAAGGISVTTPSLGTESANVMPSQSNAGSTGHDVHVSATGNVLVALLGRVPNSTYTGVTVTLGGIAGTQLIQDGTSVGGDAVLIISVIRGVAKNTGLTISIQPSGSGTSLGKICMFYADLVNLPATGWQGAVGTPARVNGTAANHVTASLTPQASGSLVVGIGGGCNANLAPLSVSSGWTVEQALTTGTTVDTDTAAVLSRRSSSTTAGVAVSNTWTSGATEDDWIAALIELKGA